MSKRPRQPFSSNNDVYIINSSLESRRNCLTTLSARKASISLDLPHWTCRAGASAATPVVCHLNNCLDNYHFWWCCYPLLASIRPPVPPWQQQLLPLSLLAIAAKELKMMDDEDGLIERKTNSAKSRSPSIGESLYASTILSIEVWLCLAAHCCAILLCCLGGEILI